MDEPLVLVADDDDDIRALVTHRLERAGYHVLAARDGQEALELAAANELALAVLDVGMPKADGLEVTERLRADERTRELPVILLTALAQEADMQRGLAAGADEYLVKPFRPQELQERVESALARH